jgi:3-(3-hydroxy-phenyl)propionate hydroxylase
VQPELEAELRATAAGYPSVELAPGCEMIACSEDDEAVELTLRGDDGQQRTVRAAYVIGADGAAGTLRRTIGATFEDLAFDQPWLVIDVHVDAAALARLPQTNVQYCEPARPCSYIIGPRNLRRWEIMLLPGEDPLAASSEANVWQLLARWITPADAKLWRTAPYRFHTLIADRWRRGRIALAGDAAHVTPPFLTQGLCQGLRDAANLAWKLDAILGGAASDDLLDTYQRERAPHVRATTLVAKTFGELIGERDPVAARERDERLLAEGNGAPPVRIRSAIVPPLADGFLRDSPAAGSIFPQPVTTGEVRLDDVHQGFRLVDVAANGAIHITPVRLAREGVAPGAPIRIEERDRFIAAWFASAGASCALVRPDHYVYGTGDPAGLIAALQNGLSPGGINRNLHE